MKSLLISSSSKEPDWSRFVNKVSLLLPFKFYQPMVLKLNEPQIAAAPGSIGGLELLQQDSGLKVFLNKLPSRKDLRFFRELGKYALSEGFKVADEQNNDWQPCSDKELQSRFAEELRECLDSDAVIERPGRRINLKALVNQFEEDHSGLEDLIIEKIDNFTTAVELEKYPVDGVDSVIWDGSEVWIPTGVNQILFSQKAFKGKLRGLVQIKDFSQILSRMIIESEYGFLVKSKNELASSDYEALQVNMENFEAAPEPPKPVSLEITAGKLEEISFHMASAIFSGQSLMKTTDKFKNEGVPEKQLEVAALAVSGMLEIAAASRGKSIEEMAAQLQKNNKMTEVAAKSVAAGFVRAVKEKGLKKQRHGLILLIVLGLILAVVFYKAIF